MPIRFIDVVLLVFTRLKLEYSLKFLFLMTMVDSKLRFVLPIVDGLKSEIRRNRSHIDVRLLSVSLLRQTSP